jgi:predicted branched-subunit amino acid permease
MPTGEVRADLRAGARAVAPMLVGVIPFGLVAGATPVNDGLGGGVAVGLSVIVFAGASQLAATDVLGSGGSALVAAMAAWTINLRLLLYSASLAPHLARERLRTRLWIAYLLTDQAYAVCVSRWGADDDPDRRVPYYLGAALLLWASWQLSTIAGVVVGATVSDEVPLEFAVPLVFLVLLVPAITGRPAATAAAVGGLGAVVAAELGAGSLSLMVGAIAGIAAGTLAELRWGEPAAPLPPPVLDVDGEAPT